VRKLSKETKKIFSCPECGEPYEAYPPDDNHPQSSLEEDYANKNADGTVIKIVHDCEECFMPITLYWYKPKVISPVG
jgi:hypothetical protein